uniref:Reverse transcriptase zinc-binding domain-containing protein n=1 Tax=Triticum urartu TaxID=4572 RepID=A0A8R7VDU0_TRIUA
MQDSITWKFTADGHYSAASAYRAQFIGLVDTDMNQNVWKNWAPPKCKFFAWLVINNRIWTADRLHRRGWPNCNLCPLCQQVQESAAHLLFQCRYTIRVWGMIKSWLALHDVQPNDWIDMVLVKDWW